MEYEEPAGRCATDPNSLVSLYVTSQSKSVDESPGRFPQEQRDMDHSFASFPRISLKVERKRGRPESVRGQTFVARTSSLFLRGRTSIRALAKLKVM